MTTKPNKFCHSNAFTLLEMLLVITLLSLMATIAIVTYRNHERYSYAEKAALEVQNFVSASLNYNADTGKWPSNHNNLNNCSFDPPKNDNFMKDYAPNQSAKSLLGTYYCWATAGDQKQIFWLALKVSNNSTKLAQRIAALLPNAVVTQNPNRRSAVNCLADNKFCFVRIEVSRASTRYHNTFIAGIGDCTQYKTRQGSGDQMQCRYTSMDEATPNPVHYNIEFNCPKGMQGSVSASINFLDVGKANGYPYTLRTLDIPSPACKNRVTTNNTHIDCSLTITAMRANQEGVAQGAYGHVGASYIGYCKDTPTPSHQTHFTY